MLARLLVSAYTTLLFALLAVATSCAPSTTTLTVSAPAATVTIPASQCNTGPIQCCNQVVTAGSGVGGIILGLLNIVVTDLDILLGVKCNPLSVIGIGGNTCEAHPVCCENNAVGGLISIGCIPINIIL